MRTRTEKTELITGQRQELRQTNCGRSKTKRGQNLDEIGPRQRPEHRHRQDRAENGPSLELIRDQCRDLIGPNGAYRVGCLYQNDGRFAQEWGDWIGMEMLSLP